MAAPATVARQPMRSECLSLYVISAIDTTTFWKPSLQKLHDLPAATSTTVASVESKSVTHNDITPHVAKLYSFSEQL